jgi:hypothetical protein
MALKISMDGSIIPLAFMMIASVTHFVSLSLVALFQASHLNDVKMGLGLIHINGFSWIFSCDVVFDHMK